MRNANPKTPTSRTKKDENTEQVICPACGGTGCETVLPSADVPFLFPCCEHCRGQGRLTMDAYREFVDRQCQPKKAVVCPTLPD